MLNHPIQATRGFTDISLNRSTHWRSSYFVIRGFVRSVTWPRQLSGSPAPSVESEFWDGDENDHVENDQVDPREAVQEALDR